jgi:surface antigen
MASFRSLLVLPLLLALAGSGAALAKEKVGGSCENKPKRSMFGGIAGQIANGALGRSGIPSSVGGVYIPIHSMISEGISRILTCKEQKQAATATQTAVRGGVGTSSSWTSESRENVTGSSTVNAQTARADGSTCLAVTDVVIVDGEETRVTKNMCRAPGASGYTLAA